MSKFSMSRRDLLKVLGLTAVGAMAAACAPSATPTAAPKGEEPVETAAPAEEVGEEKRFKILHYAQSAEPTDPDVELAEGEVRKVAYQEIADEFMEMHPNVEIEWYRFPSGVQRNEWLMARMTAQDCPDVFWGQPEYIWPHVNKGWVLDFTDQLNLPNQYVPGNTRWLDQFQEVCIISQTGPDGKLYGINLDGAGVMTNYNSQAFSEAGITDEPRTWGEYTEAWEALLEVGYIPFGADLDESNCCFGLWASEQLWNQLVWDRIWDWDDDGNGAVTGIELARHSQKGDFPDWEAYLKLAHLMKEWSAYWPHGYEGRVDYRSLYRQGKVAMEMDGNWVVSQYKRDPLPFDYGWLQFPVITKDIWPASSEKTVRIQGAWGAMQYYVPGYLSQTEPDKISVIFDWLKFSSKPDNVSAVCMETGLVPLVHGAEGLPELAPFMVVPDRATPCQGWASLGQSAREAEHTLWQKYIPSDMSDAEFLDLARATWDDEVAKILEVNPDWVLE